MKVPILSALLLSCIVVANKPHRRLRSQTTTTSSTTTRQLSDAFLQWPTSKVHHDLATQIRSLRSDDTVNVLIGYRNERGRQRILEQQQQQQQQQLCNHTSFREFSSISVVALTIPITSLSELNDDDNIAFIEPDSVAITASQATPHNIWAVQGPNSKRGGYNQTRQDQKVASTTSVSSGSCGDPDSFRIAIIDSGVDTLHYDLPCRSRPTNCIGQDFATTVEGDTWDRPMYEHGTHVMGTIGALGLNNVGLSGMIPDGNVCYIIGKALDSQGIGLVSDILSATEWAANNGAHVINISIVVPSFLNSTNLFFDNMYNTQNRLVVAAAGNDGTTQYMYPASYSSVISVTSVDDDMTPSWFSQRNDKVDLAAFGRNIISTVPLNHTESRPLAVMTASLDNSTFAGVYSQHSVVFQTPTKGRLFLCGNETDVCSGPGNHICLIQRSIVTSYDSQARQCQAGGGVGVIIYHGAADSFGGKLLSETQVRIPVISVDFGVGSVLIEQHLNTTVVVETHDYGYGYKDGTSMAAPAVTGAIGALWRGCRRCTNRQVENCLKRTTRSFGEGRFNDTYGSGMLQTRPALLCLKTEALCC